MNKKLVDNNCSMSIVVNLSERPSTLIEEAVLNKSLNFCITNENPDLYLKATKIEVNKVIRTLQIKNMFAGNDNNNMEKFTSNPGWNRHPPKEMSR